MPGSTASLPWKPLVLTRYGQRCHGSHALDALTANEDHTVGDWRRAAPVDQHAADEGDRLFRLHRRALVETDGIRHDE